MSSKWVPLHIHPGVFRQLSHSCSIYLAETLSIRLVCNLIKKADGRLDLRVNGLSKRIHTGRGGHAPQAL